MSKAWSARSAAERERLEAEFVLRHGVDLLLDERARDPEPNREESPHRDGPGRRPLFARFHSALHRGGPLPADLAAALDADPALREDFSLLLERCAVLHLPRAAAAAGTGGLDQREAGGCTLRLVASRASDGQVYLLINLPEDGTTPPPGSFGPERSSTSERGYGTIPSPGALDPERGSTPERDSREQASEPSPGPDGARGRSAEAVPGRLVVKTAEGVFLMVDLPPDTHLDTHTHSRTIRLVRAVDDPVVRAAGEPSSEIFLL